MTPISLGFAVPRSSLDTGFFMYAAIGQGPDNSSGDPVTPHLFQVDTGSCGFAVGIQQLPASYQAKVKAQGAAKLLVTYLPSKNEIWGWWAELPVLLFGAVAPSGSYDPSDYPSTTVKVMVAEKEVTTKGSHLFSGGMMGIGFNTNEASVVANNPLLSLTFQGETVTGGYVLSRGGIEVGLTETNSAGFSFIDLVIDTTSVDLVTGNPTYKGPTVDLVVTAGTVTTGTLTCDFLMDTGVQAPMLFTETANIPQALWRIAEAATGADGVFTPGDGVSITVSGGVCRYQFTLGEASPFTPPKFMVMNRAGAANSLNTSIHLLGGYDYILDYANKRIGFKYMLGGEKR